MMTLADTTLRGSYPPLVTPFREGAVDHEAYVRLLEHVVAGGSHGVVVNGTTAEPTTLTRAERTALVTTAVKTIAKRVPVVAATGAASFEETRELTLGAAAAGADALLVVTPYFVKPPVRALVEYYVAVAALTPLPLLVYHIPGRAGVSLPPAAFADIAARAPNLVGVKHASTDLGFVTELLALLGPRFRIFVGLEELSYPMMALGASGLMNAAGNLVPRKIAALADACLREDMTAARRLHFELFELNRAIFWDTNPIPMKYLLRRRGLLATNEHRLPMIAAGPDLEGRLDALLSTLPGDMR